jgi:lipopolysaccharide transport system permease protein
VVRAGVGRPLLNWREIALCSDLLVTLAGRDIRVRYKQTTVGILWVVLQPLIAALIFTFVFGLVARMPDDGRPPPPHAFSGLLAWNTFAGVLQRSSFALVSNAHLVTKVYFPREVLPLSTIVSTLIDFAVGMAVMIAMLASFGLWPGPGILLLPVWLVILVVQALGLGLAAGALMVRYRDIQHIIPVLLTLGLYASPVAWTATAIPGAYRLACALNPLSGPIEAFRWSLLGVGKLDGPALAYSVVMASLALWVGAATFRRTERRFADVL